MTHAEQGELPAAPSPRLAADSGRPAAAMGASPHFAWVILAAVALAFALGGHALMDPDEGRNAAIAGEMARSGDYVLPHLNGLPYLDKPALYFALEALAMRAIGYSELAARLPSLFFTWATMALAFFFARRLFGQAAAPTAAIACATAPLAIAMARTAIFDSALAFFMVLALVAFYEAIENAPGRKWTLLAWAAIAFGILVKGPVALAVPLLVAAPYAFWRKRSMAVWHPAGPVLMLAIALSWVMAVEARLPGFLRYALVTETWNRLTTNELKRGGPVWYFLPILLAGFFPWVLVAAAELKNLWRRATTAERPKLVFLLLWIVLPMIFFSLSHSKRAQYILPLVPAVALLAAAAFGREDGGARGTRAAAVGSLALGALLIAGGVLAPRSAKASPELLAIAVPTIFALGALLLVAGFLAWRFAGKPGPAVLALAAPFLLLPMVTTPLAHEVARNRSSAGLVAALGPQLTAETKIVGIETFSPSLAFYAGRSMQVSSADAEPLRSNYILRTYERWVHEPGSTLHPAEAWKEDLATCSQPTIFVLKPKREERALLEAAGLPLLAQDDDLIAYGPCRPAAEEKAP